jgi:protein phosphatase
LCKHFNNKFDVNAYTNEANTLICNEIQKHGGLRIGTTYVLAHIHDNTANIYNIGDSRAYLFRNNRLTQLTKDHTQTERLISIGILTPEKAKTHPERNALTQHLGIFPDEILIEPFAAQPFKLEPEDILLLCSDGLTDMLEDTEISSHIKPSQPPHETVLSLINAALRNGGKDNITVIILKAEKR